MNSLRDEMRFESDNGKPAAPPQTPVTVSLGAEVEARRGEIERKYSEPCRYWSYIHPGVLTGLQTGREGKGLNHHDEHLFILVHQTFELWFKQIIFEMEWVRDALVEMPSQGPIPNNPNPLKLRSHESVVENYDMGTALRLCIHRLERADTILRIALNGFDAMETMEPVDFLEFRDFLIPASGFQSLQMREMEILVGLKEDDRLKLNGQVYRQQFQTDKDDFTDKLDARLKQPSLKDALYRVLAHMTVPGRDEYAKLFIARKVAQYQERKKDLSKKEQVFAVGQQKLSAATEAYVRQLIAEQLGKPEQKTQENVMQLLNELGLEYRVQERCNLVMQMPDNATDATIGIILDWVATDSKMAAATVAHLASSQSDVDTEIAQLDEFFYSNEPIDTRESAEVMQKKEFTEGAIRRACLSLLSHPWTQGGSDRTKNDFSEWSLLLSTVLKLEQGFLLWRNRHARMVEMMIGRRSGTGGSSGVHYLDKTQLYRIFNDLWRIRALLIPSWAVK